MTSRQRRGAAEASVALLPAIALLLAGCSAAPHWNDGERTPADTIPDTNSDILQSVDPEQSRYFGTVADLLRVGHRDVP